MAMFTDLVKDPDSGRHELHFVNQQYDLLMFVKLDEASGKYVLSCSADEAKSIAKNWSGREFDPEHWINEAEKRCKEADARPPAHS